MPFGFNDKPRVGARPEFLIGLILYTPCFFFFISLETFFPPWLSLIFCYGETIKCFGHVRPAWGLLFPGSVTTQGHLISTPPHLLSPSGIVYTRTAVFHVGALPFSFFLNICCALRRPSSTSFFSPHCLSFREPPGPSSNLFPPSWFRSLTLTDFKGPRLLTTRL